MKVLSLIQPWASLFVAGVKKIETRSWGTPYRGRLAVHASKGFDRDLCFADPFRAALEEIEMFPPARLPTGALLGWVDLVEVREMVGSRGGSAALCVHHAASYVPPAICICGCDERLTPRERGLGLYAHGRRAWMTGEERLVAAEPIPYRGAQGLRDLPAEVAALMVAA